jgi:hypothetical protein
MGTRTVANLTAVITANNTKFKKGINGAQSELKGFQKSVNAMGSAIAGAFAVSSLIAFGKESVALADTQLKAEKALLTALDGRSGAQQELIKQAQQLQGITLFGDEETIRAQSLIAAFVEEEEQIKTIIPLVQDLATAKGMDLAGAADLVAKTLGSSTNALARYGINVEGAVGSTERLDSLSRGLADAFGGQARAAAEADVSMTQLKNAIGDLKEAIGELIAPGDTSKVIDGVNEMTETVKVLGDESVSTKNKLIKFFSGFGVSGATAEYTQTLQDIRNEQEGFTEDLTESEKALLEQQRQAEATAKALNEYKAALTLADKELEFTDSIEFLNAQLRGIQDTVNKDAWLSKFDKQTKVAHKSTKGLADAAWDLAFEMDEVEDVAEDMDLSNLRRELEMTENAALSLERAVNDAFIHMAALASESIGQMAAGAKTMEETFKDIALMITSALGNILIMAGISTTPIGVPLVLAGLAVKGFGAFVGAKMDQNIAMQSANVNITSGESMLYGNDIRMANNYSNNLYDRVG